MTPRDCPCGSGAPFADCCGPLHRGRGSGRVTAQTAEQLMRSRYSAFVVRDDAYLLLTWHPRTRPHAPLALDEELEWRRLDVRSTVAGTAADERGTVEFVAHYWDPVALQKGTQHERSAFVREDGQWYYVGPESGPESGPA